MMCVGETFLIQIIGCSVRITCTQAVIKYKVYAQGKPHTQSALSTIH